jgi:RNA polymerase sigma-54 factor
VQHLDPAGVGRDLRECLLIQIAAQQHEFAHLYARGRPMPSMGDEIRIGSLRAEAEARLEERRRSMEVAALIVDHHLHLLQKRDVKDLARAAQVTPEEAMPGWSSSARSTRGPAACTTASRRG